MKPPSASSLLVVLCALTTTAQSQNVATLVSAGYSSLPSPVIAPGQLTTFFVTGLDPVSPLPQRATSIPLPTMLAGVSVEVHQMPSGFNGAIPILAIDQRNLCSSGSAAAPAACLLTLLTVQIPYEVSAPSAVIDAAGFTTTMVSISVNGQASQSFAASAAPVNGHILNTCDFGRPSNLGCSPAVTHADGTLVSPYSPAHATETLVMYLAGLGQTSPSGSTGNPSPDPAAVVINPFTLEFDYTASAAIPVTESPVGGPPPAISFAGLTPGLVGVYQVNLSVQTPPANAVVCSGTGGSNLTLKVLFRTQVLDSVPLCVETNSAAGATGSRR